VGSAPCATGEGGGACQRPGGRRAMSRVSVKKWEDGGRGPRGILPNPMGRILTGRYRCGWYVVRGVPGPVVT